MGFTYQERLNINHGTVLICVTRNDTAWVGVDSKEAGILGKGKKTVCKIITTPKFVFSHAGINDISFTHSGGFHWDAKIDSIFRACASIRIVMEDVIQIFDTQMISVLTKVGKIRKQIPGFKPDSLKQYIVIAYFVGYERDHVKLVYKYYIPTIDSKGIITTKISNHVVKSTTGDPLFINIHCPPIIRENVEIDDRAGAIPDQIRNFINTAIRIDPIEIGPPIRIISITKNGLEWIGEHKPCK